MATQEQLVALQKILDLAQEAGLNNPLGQQSTEQKSSSANDIEAFDKEIATITKNNNTSSFLIYVNIDNIGDINEKFSKIISEQLSNNVLSSIQAVINQEFKSKYNISIYKLSAVKTAIIIILKSENKQENIRIIKEIGSSIRSMIFGSCGQQQAISFGITSRKDNEDENTLKSRCDLLLKKSKDNNSTIAYDTEYFGAGNNIQFNDVAFSVSGNEIVTICIGGSGTNIGKQFYSTIMGEHKLNKKDGKFMGNLNNEIDEALLDKINVYFNQNKKAENYSPRAVFIDLDSENLNKMKSSFLGELIDDNSFVGSKDECKINNYWPQGHYTSGKEIFYALKDSVRGIVEVCDHFQGFNYIHSINGGTGGGLTSLLQKALTDDYSANITANFAVYPDGNKKKTETDGEILSNYNALLSLNALKNCSELIFPIDNAALMAICKKKLGINDPTFADYNFLISLVLSGVTSNFRFYGEPDILSNLNKMNMAFSMWPGPTHLTMSYSPFLKNFEDTDCKTEELSPSQIEAELLSPLNNISYSFPGYKLIENGKILQLQTLFKSNNREMIGALADKLMGLPQKMADDSHAWNPNPMQYSFIYKQCEYYDKQVPLTSTTIIHSTGIGKVYQNMKSIFSTNFTAKNMLSSFYDQGMDSYEFIEADKNIDELCKQYKEIQDKKFQDPDDDDDDDDEDEEEEEEEDEDEDEEEDF